MPSIPPSNSSDADNADDAADADATDATDAADATDASRAASVFFTSCFTSVSGRAASNFTPLPPYATRLPFRFALRDRSSASWNASFFAAAALRGVFAFAFAVPWLCASCPPHVPLVCPEGRLNTELAELRDRVIPTNGRGFGGFVSAAELMSSKRVCRSPPENR